MGKQSAEKTMILENKTQTPLGEKKNMWMKAIYK